MRSFICIQVLLMLFSTLESQEIVRARTNSGFVSITKDKINTTIIPPYLEIITGSLAFSDADKNQMIDANERSLIVFQLKNNGKGPAINLEARINEKNSIPGIVVSAAKTIGTLQPGNQVSVEIPVSGTMNTTNSKASFLITIIEANGFGIDPISIEIPVRAFISPLVKIVDYKITSQTGTIIEKRKPFEVQLLVQNIGQGIANNVGVSFNVPQDMFCLSDNTSVNLGSLLPGEQKLIEYSFITNNNYADNDIKFDFHLKEQFGRYTEDKNLLITMNQQVASEKLIIQGKAFEEKKIEIGSLTSIVDKNIPFNPNKNPNKFALIIGNEDYSGNLNAETNVTFALNDASVFKEYVINVLGVPENNVYFSENATAGEMRRNIDLISKLLERIGQKSELIFYYAGHGLPEEGTKIPYLIPVDVDASNLSPAIKLSEVYSKFSNSGAGRVTVFLDACFSGGGRNQGLLAARGVKIVPRNEMIGGNLVVFSASSGEQSAHPLNKEKHGLFTFYLLKALQESAGNITYERLAEYIRSNVSIESLRENGKEQDPIVNVSPVVADEWQNWTIKD